jgi:two-component system osmolarity sensor histidine kinase EnvZ
VTLLPRSLLWRTLAVLMAALVLSQAAAVFLFDQYVTRPRVATGMRQFVSHLKTVSAALETMDPAQHEAFTARIAEMEGIRIIPVRSDMAVRPAPDVPLMRAFRERLRDSFGPNAEVYVRAARAEPEDFERRPPRLFYIRLTAGQRQYWVAIPRGRLDRDAGTAVFFWGLAGLGIAVLATFLIVWRLNRPLAELARAAERLGRGGDPPPVSESGPSEIRAVARAFNQMKDDLRKAERDRATFLAGVSHDLRTPLARLRLGVEMLEGRADDAALQGMVADIDDMGKIVDQFIDFTRGEAGEALAGVNLSELARACCERAARAGVAIRCELAETPNTLARPLAMQRAIDNLIANAARHAGGEVLVRTSVEGPHMAVAVLDRGPGIPAEKVEHVKRPFARLDASRTGQSGAGLGLAIAERVAALHGGRLELLPREGGGLEARLVLESAPDGAMEKS